MAQNEKLITLVKFDENGEMIQEIQIKESDSIIINSSNNKATPEQMEFLKNNNNKKALSRSLGGFVLVFYINNNKLFHELELKKATITRLIMLATYINYNNELVLNDEKTTLTKNIIMTKNDIKNVLNLKDSVFKSFYKESTESGILYNENGTYKLSNILFHKGSVPDTTNNYTKLYIDTARQIYHGSSVFQHKTLAYVYELIPCIHYSTNFIVKESNSSLDTIKYMSMIDICNYLNLSTERQNIFNFKKAMLSLRIKHHDNTYYLFNIVTNESEKNKIQRFAVNPLLCNSMSCYDNIGKLMKSLFIE